MLSSAYPAHPCHPNHTVFPCCTFAPRPLSALPKLSRLLPGPTYLTHQLKNKPYLRKMWDAWGIEMGGHGETDVEEGERRRRVCSS